MGKGIEREENLKQEEEATEPLLEGNLVFNPKFTSVWGRAFGLRFLPYLEKGK